MAAFKDFTSDRANPATKPFIRKELLQLYNAVSNYYKRYGSQKDTEQVKEINQLLKHFTDQDDFEASSFSSHLLVKLCCAKMISIDFLLEKILTTSVISKNIVCSISSVFELIIMEIKNQICTHGTYRCPYKMRSPPHPLITILQQRQDSCEVIINEMKHYFEIESKNKRMTQHLLAALKPFLSFVFLDLKRASKSWDVMPFNIALTQLMRRMEEAGERHVAVDIAKFLLKMISCRKTNGLLILENVSLTEQLSHCLLEFPCIDEISKCVTELGYIVISQCHKLIQTNLSISMHLELMLKIFLKFPELFISEEFVYLLALLLYRSPTIFKGSVLKLAIHVLPCYTASCKSPSQFRVLKAFTLPLMVILSGNLGLQEEEDLLMLAENILMNIESHLASCVDSIDIDKQDFQLSLHSPFELIIAKHHTLLLHEISRSKTSALAFLKALKDAKSYSDSTLLLLSTLVVNVEDTDILSETLSLLLELGENDPVLGVRFLPLLLHASNRSTDSKIKFQILEYLPSLAVNKHVVSPVLKALTMLSNCIPLLPLSIRLTTNLWKTQPRIFQYLFQLLSKNVNANGLCPSVWEEITIAKAASIFEICKLRPAQHGPDVIGMLAKIFDDFEQGSFDTRPEVAETVVYLGLEALKALCEAEVSDFHTVWAVVSSKVVSHSSDLILKGIISFLGIVPLVLGTSKADMELRTYACSFIWQHVGHQNPNIISTASVCLTNFSTEEFIVERLPEKVRRDAIDLFVRKRNLKKRQEDDDYDPEREPLIGPNYVSLLEDLESEAAKGYSLLLSKVLKEEVEMLPRNISSASAAKRLISTYDRYIESIPNFLTSLYEKNSNPALIPGIAAGILSCYMSTINLSRSEKIGRRHLIEDAKAHRQMLDNLLSEISITVMDWKQCVTAPTSWSKFMSRIFNSTVEVRKAELSLHFDQGRVLSEEEMEIEVSNSQYWARDQLTIQLMKASRGHPTLQGNSILALAGLAVTIANENGPMGDKNQSTQYCNTKNWLVKVADTVMVVFDGNFKSKGQPFQWCQQFSSHKSTASSLLARACAAVALSEIAATLISIDFERIEDISQLLMSRISGQEKAGTSSVIQFNAAIGLGLLVNRLQQKRFNDVTGEDGYQLTRKIFHMLEETVYNEDLQNREGAIFGHGLVLGSLCLDDAKDSRLHAMKHYDRLFETVRSFDLAKGIKLMDESCFFALGAATINCFKTGLTGFECVVKVMGVLKEASNTIKESFSLRTIYGFLLYGLLCSGLSQVKDVIEENIDIWLKDVTDVKKELPERIASIHGLFSVFGAMSFLFPCDDLDVFDSALKTKLTVTIKIVQQAIEVNGDAEFCTHSCKLLSLFYMTYHGGASHQSALPSDFNYLPEVSLLRNFFNYLLDAGKSGPCGRFSAPAINSILTSLCCAAEIKLPPANWPQVLNPLMKLGFGEESRRLCLKFAIRIASSCPTLPTWLLSWMSPSVFLFLELSCKRELLNNIAVIVSIVPLNKVKMIVEELMVKIFQNEDGCLEEQLLVLQSLKELANIVNPVQSSLVFVTHALIQICRDENILKIKHIIKGITEVLLCLPNELKVNVLDSLQTTDLIIGIESGMVEFFQSSLKCMDRAFHIASADPVNLTPLSLQSMTSALQFHFLNGTSPEEHDQRVFWFLDQLGRLKLFITNKLSNESHRWLGILASTTTMWSASGLNVVVLDYEINALHNAASMDLFGVQLNYLLEQNNWQNLREKVFNWLIELAEISRTNIDEKDESLPSLLKGTILRLSQSATWTSQENWIKSMDIVLSTKPSYMK